MHSRLPLFAGVPGKSAAVALTAALLVSGCTPNPFGPPETAEVEPLSAAEALPAAAGQSAESRMVQAAAAVAEQVHDARPRTLGPASSGPVTQVEDTAPDDDAEEGVDSEEDAGSGHAPEQQKNSGLVRHRDQLESWSSTVSEAHQAAEEEQRRAEEETQRLQEEAEEADRLQEEAAEAERQAEAEAAEQAEAPEEDDDEDVLDPQTEESEQIPDTSQLNESLSPPATPTEPDVEFTGDLPEYLQNLTEAHPGNISISLQELSGAQRQAAVGGNSSSVTASTYKLYVAYSIIRQVESGAMSWSDSITGGRDLDQCFTDMIAVSDNPCPEAIGPEIGWSTIYSDASAAGASSTGQGGGAIVTSPNDLTAMLIRLEAGQLSMSEAGHERLRAALAANVHRFGVPAGSAGQVLNKPGWIDGHIHDAAIVHHPQGTYVLSIMSEGSSWDALASITRDIEAALYG